MKTRNSNTYNDVLAVQKTAKFAGWVYFVIIISSLLSLAVGTNKLIVENDMALTIENINSNQFLFRAGIVYEIFMYTGVIFLSVALFQLLKSIGTAKALTALLCRFGEVIMGFLTVIGSIITLYLINKVGAGSIRDILDTIFEIKNALMSALMIFISVGSIIFFHLFHISRYIPRWLSIFGITAFSFVLIETLVLLLFPMRSWVFPGASAVLFEIVIGLWLIIKGVDTNKHEIIQKN